MTTRDNEWQWNNTPLGRMKVYDWKWTIESGVLKKIYFLYKNEMLEIDPLKSGCSQNQQYPERILRLKVLRKSSSLEKVPAPKVTLAIAIVYNCSSKIFTILYELLQLLLGNCQINRKHLFQKSPLLVEMSTIAPLKDLLYLTLRHRTAF